MQAGRLTQPASLGYWKTEKLDRFLPLTGVFADSRYFAAQSQRVVPEALCIAVKQGGRARSSTWRMFPANPPAANGSESAVSAASGWLMALLGGEAALLVATLAVAFLGFVFLSGRLEWRRAGFVVLGISLLFGASSIAAGLIGLGSGSVGSSVDAPLPPPTPPTAVPSAMADPYAGASVPG